MNVQHLSDEAVAAFADGVLGGRARERAGKHVEECAECRTAVRVQREAALALRASRAPALPSELAARLCSLPQTTPVSTLPTAVAPDGSTVLATRFMAPMSALVPPADKTDSRRRVKPIATAVALAALAGAVTAGSVAGQAQSPSRTGNGSVVHQRDGGTPSGVAPAGVVSVVKAHHR